MGVTLHFQSSGSIPGDGRPVPMVGNSLTIGRGKDNNLVLPDPERVISSHHCAIEDQNGNVVVIDLSSNGTFLNYGKIPLGRVPTPLNDGDILSIGNYELAVQITSAAAAPRPELLDPAAPGGIAPSGARPDDDLGGLLDAPSSSGGRDVISELLDAPSGPVGPKGIKRPELGEDGLLPPLGEESTGDPLAPGPDPDDALGPSQAMNSPSVADQMKLPRVSSETIPDDWDLDLPTGQSNPPSSIPEPEPVPVATPVEPGIGEGGAFIPDDLDLGFGGPPADGTEPPPDPDNPFARAEEPASGSPAESQPAPARATGPDPAASAARVPGAGAGAKVEGAALKTLLDAAGMGDLDLSGEDPEETAARLGNVLRILIHGMREILMTRTSIKSEFRIDQTRIAASGNNPLKFSVTPEQAVEVMVRPPQRGYLSAEAAAEQALQDIKAHEVATMTGMEAALKGVLQRLSPEALEAEMTGSGGIGGLLKGRKARYWETYEKIFADVADAAENDFHELFAREFARAYQEQLSKLKDRT